MSLARYERTRRTHQQNIPLWMVRDLNSGLNGSRVYLDQVLPKYPEVIMTSEDWENSIGGVNPKLVKMKSNWKGCHRLMSTGGGTTSTGLRRHGKFWKCRFTPINNSKYCHHHYKLAIKDGRVKNERCEENKSKQQKAWQRIREAFSFNRRRSTQPR